jgi:hypothetical protein
MRVRARQMAAGESDGVDGGLAMLVSFVCAPRRAWPRSAMHGAEGSLTPFGFKLVFARLVRAATRAFGVPFVAALRPVVSKLLESAASATVAASATPAAAASVGTSVASAMRVDERNEQCVAAECAGGVLRGVRYWSQADSAGVIEWATSLLVDALRKGTPTDTSREWLAAVCVLVSV